MKKISEAAFSLIAEQGFEATSISQIAKEAGISKGLLYNYYESKEQLLGVLVNNAFSHGDEVVASILDSDPLVVMKNLIHWFFKEMREHPDSWRLITEVTLKIDKYKFVHDLAVQKMQGYLDLMQSLFQQLGYDDPLGEARLLAAIFDGVGIEVLVLQRDFPLDEMEKIMIERYCERKPKR